MADEIQTTLLPVTKIYSNPDFNCRGEISSLDVLDLAKSIKEVGLMQPVVVRPRTDKTPLEYDWELICGHRRHRAYIVNAEEKIPAIIKRDVNEIDAKTLNFMENLKRKDLNIRQEAGVVKFYDNLGFSRDKIAKVLGIGVGWVQVRLMFSTLQPEIQDAIVAGLINQTEIRHLYSIKDRNVQLQAARKIKEARERRDGKPVVEVVPKIRKKPDAKFHRKRGEIFEMMEHVQSIVGNNLATRALAWAAGEISNEEFYYSLKDAADEQGVPYTPRHLTQFTHEVVTTCSL